MNCPRCGRKLSKIDGAWICFTPWQKCGVMMEGRFDENGTFTKYGDIVGLC